MIVSSSLPFIVVCDGKVLVLHAGITVDGKRLLLREFLCALRRTARE